MLLHKVLIFAKIIVASQVPLKIKDVSAFQDQDHKTLKLCDPFVTNIIIKMSLQNIETLNSCILSLMAKLGSDDILYLNVDALEALCTSLFSLLWNINDKLSSIHINGDLITTDDYDILINNTVTVMEILALAMKRSFYPRIFSEIVYSVCNLRGYNMLTKSFKHDFEKFIIIIKKDLSVDFQNEIFGIIHEECAENLLLYMSTTEIEDNILKSARCYLIFLNIGLIDIKRLNTPKFIEISNLQYNLIVKIPTIEALFIQINYIFVFELIGILNINFLTTLSAHVDSIILNRIVLFEGVNDLPLLPYQLLELAKIVIIKFPLGIFTILDIYMNLLSLYINTSDLPVFLTKLENILKISIIKLDNDIFVENFFSFGLDFHLFRLFNNFKGEMMEVFSKYLHIIKICSINPENFKNKRLHVACIFDCLLKLNKMRFFYNQETILNITICILKILKNIKKAGLYHQIVCNENIEVFTDYFMIYDIPRVYVKKLRHLYLKINEE